MKVGLFYKKFYLREDERVKSLIAALGKAGHEVYFIGSESIEEDTSLILSLGGDGTFLTAAALVASSPYPTTPLMGLNMGRIGFLAESYNDDTVARIAAGQFTIEPMPLLEATGFTGEGFCTANPHGVNEVTLHRISPVMLGIDVAVDGVALPTYWADGLIVSTPAGSTAYSLSAGGPILFPQSGSLVITPIAPHNLNIRPLVIPQGSSLEIKVRSKFDVVMLSVDNRSQKVSIKDTITVTLAKNPLQRARLQGGGDFISALKTKLFWGEDIRS